MSEIKTAAVIQARMGSSRLPGKMMMDLCGKPVLWHIIERARRIRHAYDIVLATSHHDRDDVLADVASAEGVLVVRGSEDNVLKRYMKAMKMTGADYIVRITGDAVLFDPAFQDQWINGLIASGADYTRVLESRPHAHQGAGTISAGGLRWIWEVGRNDPLAREHVTAYARKHQEKLKTVPIDIDPELVGEFHLSIDTAKDLERMRWIYGRLYNSGEIVSLLDAVRLLRKSPFPVRNKK